MDDDSTSEPLASGPSTADEPAQAKSQQLGSLQPLYEASESDTMSPEYSPPPIIHVNGQGTIAGGSGVKDGEVMKATMTDVQKAIEQLGRRGNTEDGDAGQSMRSYSFASTRDGEDTDTDFDQSDADADAGGDGEAWHKGTRRRLAEKARRAVEEAEKLEMIMNGNRNVAPPIEVELSDESEGEEEDYQHDMSYIRRHSKIPEEDEGEEDEEERRPTPAQQALTLPELDESELHTATAGQSTFPSLPHHRDSAGSKTHSRNTSTANSASATPAPRAETPSNPVLASLEQKRSSTPSAPYRESLIALPSPSASSTGFPHITSKHSSVASATSLPRDMSQSFSSSNPGPLTSSSMQPTLVNEPIHSEGEKDKGSEDKAGHETKQPIDWDVEDVIEWLKSKGFGADVADKFKGELVQILHWNKVLTLS